MRTLSDVSVYYLILELLDHGETGLLPELEPINPLDLLSELRLRTGVDKGEDPRAWAYWFIGDPTFGNELERANLLLSIKTEEAMTQIWKTVRMRPQ